MTGLLCPPSPFWHIGKCAIKRVIVASVRPAIFPSSVSVGNGDEKISLLSESQNFAPIATEEFGHRKELQEFSSAGSYHTIDAISRQHLFGALRWIFESAFKINRNRSYLPTSYYGYRFTVISDMQRASRNVFSIHYEINPRTFHENCISRLASYRQQSEEGDNGINNSDTRGYPLWFHGLLFVVLGGISFAVSLIFIGIAGTAFLDEKTIKCAVYLGLACPAWFLGWHFLFHVNG